MSFVRPAPEAADGGYWYVVPASTEQGGRDPGLPFGWLWCAWHGEIDGTQYAAVRLPERRDVPGAVDIPVASVLSGWTGKPRGRSGGQ